MPNIVPKDSIRQVALIVVYNPQQEILLLKRKEGVHQAGLWSFPGGKIEVGEGALQAAKRELLEECSLYGEAWKELGETQHQYRDVSLCFHLYRCQVQAVANLCCESKWRWVAEDKLTQWPMPDANVEMLKLVSPPRLPSVPICKNGNTPSPVTGSTTA
ncbi:MAG: NUDIX domain-containing protein [Mariprofundaceae bacterium]